MQLLFWKILYIYLKENRTFWEKSYLFEWLDPNETLWFIWCLLIYRMSFCELHSMHFLSQGKLFAMTLCASKWATANITEHVSLQCRHPVGAARAHASTLSSPLACFLRWCICCFATFSFSLLFAFVRDILIVSSPCILSIPCSCAFSQPEGSFNWSLASAEIVTQSKAGGE